MDVSINKNDKDGLKHQLKGLCNVIETCSSANTVCKVTLAPTPCSNSIDESLAAKLLKKSRVSQCGYADKDSVEQVSA